MASGFVTAYGGQGGAQRHAFACPPGTTASSGTASSGSSTRCVAQLLIFTATLQGGRERRGRARRMPGKLAPVACRRAGVPAPRRPRSTAACMYRKPTGEICPAPAAPADRLGVGNKAATSPALATDKPCPQEVHQGRGTPCPVRPLPDRQRFPHPRRQLGQQHCRQLPRPSRAIGEHCSRRGRQGRGRWGAKHFRPAGLGALPIERLLGTARAALAQTPGCTSQTSKETSADGSMAGHADLRFGATLHPGPETQQQPAAWTAGRAAARRARTTPQAGCRPAHLRRPAGCTPS